MNKQSSLKSKKLFFAKCAKRQRIKNNEEKSKLWRFVSCRRNGWRDFLQIWNVNYPSWWAMLQQIWFQPLKRSSRYKGVKMMFSFFLSIYPWCVVLTSWATQHTILDGKILFVNMAGFHSVGQICERVCKN